MIGVMPVLVVTLLISMATNMYLYLKQPEPRYFATHEGRLIEMVALNLPYVSDKFILQWAADSVISIYAIDFMNYRKQITEMGPLFTRDGFKVFQEAITQRRLRGIVENRMVSSAVVTGTPVILGTAVANGTFIWRIRVPVVATVANNERRLTTNYHVTLVVSRTETFMNPHGIAISQFIEEPAF